MAFELVQSAPASNAPLDVTALLAKQTKSTRPSVLVDKEDDLQYDLGRLCAIDPTPVDETALERSGDGYLSRTARENAQLLVNQLYTLFATQDTKVLIRLPPPEIALPREKPLPKPKPLTRWEKFAKEKGILKKKRSKMVWDEAAQRWAPRYGYGRANDPNDKMKDWMVEVKGNANPSFDPFEDKAEKRKEALSKQKRQKERNRLEAAHAAGITGRGAGGSAGAGRVSALKGGEKKSYLEQGIRAAQVSTASIGRFDCKLEHEPSKHKDKRRQYEGATDKGVQKVEHDRAAKVADRLFPDHKASTTLNATTAAKMAMLDEERANRAKKLAKPAKGAAAMGGVAKGKGAKNGVGKGGRGKSGGAKGGRGKK